MVIQDEKQQEINTSLVYPGDFASFMVTDQSGKIETIIVSIHQRDVLNQIRIQAHVPIAECQVITLTNVIAFMDFFEISSSQNKRNSNL